MENERKIQILKAAAKRFARHGLNKTTLTEIARDLRIGKATIYHYFTSKEELFYLTQEYDASLFLEDIKKIFGNGGKSLKEKVYDYLLYKEDIYNKYKLLYDLISRHLLEEGPEKEQQILKNLFSSEEDIIRKLLCSSFGNKSDAAVSDLSFVITTQSWGILFGNKLNVFVNAERLPNIKEAVYKSLEGLLTV